MMQGELFSRVLLTGPAGCGKTHRILGLYLQEIAAGREEQVLLLSPTTSFREHTRNTVLRSGAIRSFSGRSVATFSDLGLAEEAGLTSARQELLVRRLLREMDLPDFRDVAGFPGFRRALVDEAEEALASGITPRSSPRREAFSQFLRRYETATAPFRPAPKTVARPTLLLVDGFTGFTRPQQQILATLVERAATALVTLPPGCGPARDFLVQQLGFREEAMEGNHRSQGLLTRCQSAPSRREEVEIVASRVQELVNGDGYKYHEIGVIVHNAEAYLTLIGDLFRHHQIPARLFFPLTAPDTALGRHLLSCLNLFPRPTPEAVLALLKSAYSPILRRDKVNEFEYEVTAHRRHAENGNWIACLGKNPFEPLMKFFELVAGLEKQREAATSVAEMARWVSSLWDTLTLPREIPPGIPHALALDLRADASAEKEAQEITAEIAAAVEAEKEQLDFAGFAALLESELRRRPFHVRDRRSDAVNVMNPYEARQWELRAVFVVGLIEKEFPRAPRRSLFLDDAMEESLREEARLFYVATTRARERLTLSHPLADERGVPLLPSFFLDGVPEAPPPDPVDLVAEAPAAVAPARLRLPLNLARLREREVSFSASRFGTFAQCPFKHFAQYVLRLKGEPKAAEGLTPLLQGSIVHRTLHDWEFGGRTEPIENMFASVFASETAEIPLHHAEEKIRSRMLQDLKRFVEAEALHSSVYRTTVDRSLLEKSFGRKDTETPILEWTIEDGTKIQLTGRLDRVETVEADGRRLGLVVDFKYSKNGFDADRLKQIQEGQDLQIPLYLLALQESLGIEPAGAELYVLRDEPSRAGLINEAFAGRIYCGDPPKKTVFRSPADFRLLLEKGRAWMRKYAGQIRAGEIQVEPRKTDYCRKGGCDFYDLCRIEKV